MIYPETALVGLGLVIGFALLLVVVMFIFSELMVRIAYLFTDETPPPLWRRDA